MTNHPPTLSSISIWGACIPICGITFLAHHYPLQMQFDRTPLVAPSPFFPILSCFDALEINESIFLYKNGEVYLLPPHSFPGLRMTSSFIFFFFLHYRELEWMTLLLSGIYQSVAGFPPRNFPCRKRFPSSLLFCTRNSKSSP